MNETHADIPNPHRLIRASAGSGKTYQLSSRYLALLRDGTDADRILATTFTRKAAGEILARVLSRLVEDDGSLTQELAHVFPPSPGQAQRSPRQIIEALTQKLHRLSISTLDSFFHRLATSFALELSLPVSVTLMDDTDQRVTELRLEAIEAVLTEAGESDASFFALLELLQRLHHDQAKRSTTEAILQIVQALHEKYVEQPAEAAWARPPISQSLLTDLEIDQITSELLAAEDDVPKTKKTGEPNKRCAVAYSNLLKAVQTGSWSDMLEMTLLNNALKDPPQYYQATLPETWVKLFVKLLEHAAAAEIQKLRASNIARYGLLEKFDQHFTALKRLHGVLTFTDVTTLLCQSLPDRQELYYRLDGRIEHVLLDEFQDTSPAQWQVLRPLAEEAAASTDRSFFCVGDIKQAIYGWRGGCAQLFDTVIHDLHLSSESIQDLSLNWRSSQIVLDCVNQVFGHLNTWPVMLDDPVLADAAEVWTKGYQHHKSAKKNQDLSGYVCLLSSETDREEDASSDDTDVEDFEDEHPVVVKVHDRFVADQIEQLTRDHPDRSIGVLVRRRKYAATLLDQLRLRQVAASGEGGVAITDDYMVNLILAAMELADHPGNDIAAFQLTHSPMADILGLLNQSPQTVALAIRQRLMDEGYAVVVASWVDELLPIGDERNRRRLQQLLYLTDAYESTVTGEAMVRPSRFGRYIKERRVEESSAAAVRVMTVHQSKGLEFDIVVLPELLGDTFGSITRHDVYIERDEPTGPITGVYPSASEHVRAISPSLTRSFEQEQRRRLDDDLAVLYVAMTRAKRALWMIVPPIETTQRGLSTVGRTNATYATLLRQSLSNMLELDNDLSQLTEARSLLYEHGDPDWDWDSRVHVTDMSSALSSTFFHRQINVLASDGGRSLEGIAPSGFAAGGRVAGRDLLSKEGAVARLRGSVIHAWFESVGCLDEQERPGHAAMLDVALALGASPEQAETWMPTFDQALQQSELVALLSRRRGGERDVVYNELSLATIEASGQLVQGRADRVVVYGDQSGAEIVDFKTDTLTDPMDDTQTAQIVERYRSQLMWYVEAVAKRFTIKPASITARIALVPAGRVLTVQRGG